MITAMSGRSVARFPHQHTAIHARQAQIGEQHIDIRMLLQNVERLLAVFRFQNVVAEFGHHIHGGHADQCHIFDDKNFLWARCWVSAVVWWR